MPLNKSGTKAAFKENVGTLMGEIGKSPHVNSREQALAISYSLRRKGHANGGVVRGYDIGGGVNPQMMAAMAAMAQRPPMNVPGTPPNPVNQGLNANPGVAPNPAMPMSAPGQMTPPAPAPTGVAQPPSPGTMTTPTNPMSRPLMARGGALDRASGGFNMARGPNLNPSWEEKQEARSMMHVGPVLSSVPGRTDRHNLMVPSSSYVVPADIVSGRGQGNTLAGANFFQKAFHMGPYGGPSMGIKHGMGAPRPPRVPGMMHSGGGKGGDNKIGTPVPVVVAGGEIIIPPDKLVQGLHDMLGYWPKDMKHAHRLMDAWMLEERKNLRKTLAKLPGPAKD